MCGDGGGVVLGRNGGVAGCQCGVVAVVGAYYICLFLGGKGEGGDG